MSKKGPRARAWVFTLNNYTKDDEQYLQNVLDCSYIVYGREVSPSGTPHLQGYMYFDNPRSGSAIGKLRKWWTEPAKADSLSNGAYTKKGDDWFEKGTRPATQKEKGDRNADRYKRAYDAAMEGDFASIDPDILIRHYTTLKRFKSELTPVKSMESMPLCLYLWGETGSGKSHVVETLCAGTAYVKDANTKWWTDYKHEDVVTVEEIEPTSYELQAMYKRLCDKYRAPVETKGGNLIIRPRVVIFTSNHPPESVFGAATQPMLRRIRVYHLTLENRENVQSQIYEVYRAFQASGGSLEGSPSPSEDGISS